MTLFPSNSLEKGYLKTEVDRALHPKTVLWLKNHYIICVDWFITVVRATECKINWLSFVEVTGVAKVCQYNLESRWIYLIRR